MGSSNSFQNTKQQALKNRETTLQNQMIEMNKCFQKYHITAEKALQIASFNVYQIVDKLNSQELTSEEILSALVYRCNTVGKKLNFFTGTNYSWALVAARARDQERQVSKKKNWTFEDGEYNQQMHYPPLFGIPISIKDVFHVESMTTTVGLCSKALNYEPQSPLITCFKNSGMIPFIKTNVPQFCIACETNNNLWGRTLNPWNQKRTVGGSSGGEGGAISSRCSFIGVGSDIGGSIRIPSEFCGLFGLKPSSRRISGSYHAELALSLHSFGKNIPVCTGPMGKSARDLALFMDIATHESFFQGKHDPYVKILPFDPKQFLQSEQGNTKWRIGVIKSLKDIKPSVASQRALSFTIDLLKKQGHEVFEIEIPNERQVIREFIGEYGSSMKTLITALKNEKPIDEYRTLLKMFQLPWVLQLIIEKLAKKFMPRIYFYFLAKKSFKKVLQYQHHLGQISELKNIWIKYWKNNHLDFVICPGLGCQALPHGLSEKLGMPFFYTSIWNVLDMTVGSVPVTLVKQDEQTYESEHRDFVTTLLKQVAWQSQGLPVGIQVVGLPYEEERVLGLMSYLEKKIKFYQQYPLPNI